MDQRRRALVACGGIVVIFLCVQLGAVAVVEPFESAGLQPDVDHQDPVNSLLYVLAILVATLLMLGAFRLGIERFLRAIVVLSGAYIAVFVFRILFPPIVDVGGIHVLAWAGGAALGIALYRYPEWYVIDLAGIAMGIGAAGLFGITFGVLPALILLAVLAVYDAISVYGTKHMLTLASGVMEMRVPIVLVVPLSLDYSFLDADLPDPSGADGNDETEEGGETSASDRDALFIGLGDAVIPTVLVASATFFAPQTVPNIGGTFLSIPLTAAMAIAGTLVGLVILLWMVLQGRAHAGLPLLNGGAIGGYLIGALASGLSLVSAVGLSG